MTCLNDLSSMREFLKCKPSAVVLNYVAKTKHKVLSIIRDKHAILLIPISEYMGLMYDSKLNVVTVSYKSREQIENVTVDFNEENSDIVGFSDMDSACDYLYDNETLIINPIQFSGDEYKLIFSPQLAKYLIRHKHIVWDIKENKNKPDEIVFVFKVDGTFYEDIENFKTKR